MYELLIMRFCVQVKNKPCARRTSYMRLISWIHHRGSETTVINSVHTWNQCAGGPSPINLSNFLFQDFLLFSFLSRLYMLLSMGQFTPLLYISSHNFFLLHPPSLLESSLSLLCVHHWLVLPICLSLPCLCAPPPLRDRTARCVHNLPILR